MTLVNVLFAREVDSGGGVVGRSAGVAIASVDGGMLCLARNVMFC